ncbi:MAG: STAS domain-containing protein [Candidatus Eisenbacteria bacterium]|nr:STAS domain-containing protein [Candidatus Eisenbacteria bacterium]
MLEIRIDEEGRILLTGRLDASQADEAMVRFRQLEGPITADFSGLDYISSAGISVIVETYKRLHGAGHLFRLVNMKPRVRNVFMYSGLDRVLHIE